LIGGLTRNRLKIIHIFKKNRVGRLKKRARVNIKRRAIRRKMKKARVTLEIIGKGIPGWGLKEIFSPRECGAL
jgi:hypothetical protein